MEDYAAGGRIAGVGQQQAAVGVPTDDCVEWGALHRKAVRGSQ